MSTRQNHPGFRRQQSQEGVSGNGFSSPAPPPLQRSHTVVERGSSSAGPKRSREPSSPLKRFARAKESISKTFGHICAQLAETQAFLRQAHGGVEPAAVSALLARNQGIVDILARDHMKVAFFGRTSNGKSSVINALLGSKVLPAGIGHTTNCFCSVIGSDNEEGYLLSPGSQEQQNVKNVQQLAHSLHKKHLAHSSLVQVFWPKSRCLLLKDDVEFVDSPGIDMNPDMDEWINRHCLDADVFVLVSNAESTLMNAEKSFFHRVSECLSKPNIFILNNRWDASAQEPELMEEVRAQHLERDLGFLTRELKVTDEQTARNRVFFVSAKEVLQHRMRTRENAPDPGAGLADGYKVRLMEFEQFEGQFKTCISDSAIRTKFEQHHRQGLEVVSELDSLMEDEATQLQEQSAQVQTQLQSCCLRLGQLESKAAEVRDDCQQRIGAVSNEVQQRITMAMGDIVGQMATLVDECDANFDSAHIATYKLSLFEYMDRRLEAELGRVSGAVLAGLQDEAQQSLVEAYQDLLQLPEQEPSRYSQLPRPPELSCVLLCQDLCRDFHEDLQFRFTLLGVLPLMNKINVGALLGGAPSQVSELTRTIPLHYSLPVLGILLGTMITRFPSWRILVPVVGTFAGIFLYEKLTWTDRSKKAELKRQFVSHLRSQVDQQVASTSRSHSRSVAISLGQLQRQLHADLEKSRKEEQAAQSRLSDEQTRLAQLQEIARRLRNAVQLVHKDLQDFGEEFLDAMT